MARITVEDCLTKETNRFALVSLSSKRAKQLLAGSKCLVDSKGNKSVVSSLREIAAGVVRFMTEDEVTAEVDREAREKIEADEAKRAAQIAATQHVEVRDSAGTLLNPLPPQGSSLEAEKALFSTPFAEEKKEEVPPLFKESSPSSSDF